MTSMGIIYPCAQRRKNEAKAKSRLSAENNIENVYKGGVTVPPCFDAPVAAYPMQNA